MARPFHPHPGFSGALFPPWDLDHWEAVDDRVRGGSSVSHLDRIEISRDGQLRSPTARYWDIDDDEVDETRLWTYTTRFWGTLDTQTLGGAGFASQCYRFEPSRPVSLPPSTYRGIRMILAADTLTYGSRPPPYAKPSLPHTFTLVLKTQPPLPRRPDGRRASSLTYEASIPIPYTEWTVVHTLPWSSFAPFYRGKPVKEGDEMYRPLQTESVYEISLMCRSEFGQQEGVFGVLVHLIQGWKVEAEESGKVKREREGVVGCFAWLRAKWETMRLKEKEKEKTRQKLRKSRPVVQQDEKRLLG